MIPRPPPRDGSLGFLYLPPFRVQGFSVAGEATTISIPEMDLCFDMGRAPRAHLAPQHCLISHGHMDHIGALAYWCSQRNFQGMGPGTIVCDPRIERDVRGMMDGFIALERQKTPYKLVALDEGEELEIKNNMVVRPFRADHTCPAMGYTLVEKRTKLKPELMGLPQEKLKELKDRGEEIVNHLEVPLIAYTGDTLPGGHLLRPEVMNAQIIIAECTFFDRDHRDRAKTGMHMHVSDIAEWLRVAQCEDMVLVHISRRTHLGHARKALLDLVGEDLGAKVHLLMDHRANKERYEAQADEAERREQELASRS